MWLAIWLSEKGETFKKIPLRHQISKTRTVVLRELTYTFSRILYCAWTAFKPVNEARATKISDIYEPSELETENGLSGRPVQFHWHIFAGHTVFQARERNSHIVGITETVDIQCQLKSKRVKGHFVSNYARNNNFVITTLLGCNHLCICAVINRQLTTEDFRNLVHRTFFVEIELTASGDGLELPSILEPTWDKAALARSVSSSTCLLTLPTFWT